MSIVLYASDIDSFQRESVFFLSSFLHADVVYELASSKGKKGEGKEIFFFAVASISILISIPFLDAIASFSLLTRDALGMCYYVDEIYSSRYVYIYMCVCVSDRIIFLSNRSRYITWIQCRKRLGRFSVIIRSR